MLSIETHLKYKDKYQQIESNWIEKDIPYKHEAEEGWNSYDVK